MLKLEKSQFQNTQNPVTQEDIARLRKTRDDLWEQMKSGDKTLPEEAVEYETRLAKADEGADRRYDRAADVQRLETFQHDIEELQLSLQGLEQTGEKYKIEHDKVRTEINAILGKLGLTGLETSAFLKWVQHAEKALDCYLSLANAEKQLTRLEEKETGMSSKLRKVLVDAGQSNDATSSLSLNGLTTRTNRLILEAQNSKTKKTALQEALTTADIKLVHLRKRAETATSDMEEWNAEWGKQILRANLFEDIGLFGVQRALELLSKLAVDSEKLQDLRVSRIDAMQHDLDDYENMVATLTANIILKKNGLSTDQISIELSARLDKAQNDKNHSEKLHSELSKNNRTREDLISQKERVEANIKPLMTQAKAKDADDLRLAISMSDKFRDIENDIKEAEKIILDNGDGLPLNELKTEIENEDLKSIPARLNEISNELDEASAMRDECLLRKKEAEDARSEVRGEADAADAESQRQEALSTMAVHTQRYIKIFIAEPLLQWSIDRFREEKQGPLLQRAGAIFSMLTLGSFEKLTVDFASDDLRLTGRRPNGQHVDFEGLSEGTGDQLYLALRLAAVELQLQSMQALPFIADDLFINYDDKRSAAGFQALAELAKKAQVIFFTHHDHLIEVARNAVGSNLNIIEL